MVSYTDTHTVDILPAMYVSDCSGAKEGQSLSEFKEDEQFDCMVSSYCYNIGLQQPMANLVFS